MARANQGKWFADVLVSQSAGSRSRETGSLPAGAAVEAGTIATIAAPVGNAPHGVITIPPTTANVNCIVLAGIPARTAPMPVLVLRRDAEVNDAYMLYGGLNTALVNAALGGAGVNIIVRAGVLPTSIPAPSGFGFEWGPEGEPIDRGEGDPPEPVAA